MIGIFRGVVCKWRLVRLFFRIFDLYIWNIFNDISRTHLRSRWFTYGLKFIIFPTLFQKPVFQPMKPRNVRGFAVFLSLLRRRKTATYILVFKLSFVYFLFSGILIFFHWKFFLFSGKLPESDDFLNRGIYQEYFLSFKLGFVHFPEFSFFNFYFKLFFPKILKILLFFIKPLYKTPNFYFEELWTPFFNYSISRYA